MSSTILPPRFDDRAAQLDEGFPVIPVYEEVSGSLRPTWIPVDPTTFVPPPPKKSRAKTFAIAVPLALLTWGLGFASVVGGHAIEERYAHKANATPAQISDPAPAIATVAQAPTPTPSVATIAAAQPAKQSSDSGIMMTIDVNDLPVIKPGKGRAKPRRAGS